MAGRNRRKAVQRVCRIKANPTKSDRIKAIVEELFRARDAKDAKGGNAGVWTSRVSGAECLGFGRTGRRMDGIMKSE